MESHVAVLIRRALTAIKPTMQEAFQAVNHQPPPGSELDQVGLINGGQTVADYLGHGEAELAFDHLLYMIVEPPLPITSSTFETLRAVADRLGTEPSVLDEIRTLVVSGS